MALVGLSKTVAIEGDRYNIRCNAIAPIAASRMTENILPDFVLEKLDPKYVVPLTLYLAHETCQENGSVFEVGGGWAGKVRIEAAKGCMINKTALPTMEDVHQNFDKICSFDESVTVDSLQEATMRIMANIMDD